MPEAVFDFKAIRAAMGKDIPLDYGDAKQVDAPADQVKALAELLEQSEQLKAHAEMLQKGNEAAWKDWPALPYSLNELPFLEGDNSYFVISSSGLLPSEENELPF